MKNVLILCTGNSCRSQMAEVLLNHDLAGQVHALSAGTKPQPKVADGAIAALTPVTGAEGAAPVLARLAAFPSLPRATEALARARIGMHRMDRDGGRSGLWRS